MPFLCIGPVCIPWTALFPLLCLALRPVYNVMPSSVQAKLDVVYEWVYEWILYLTPSFMKPKVKKDVKPDSPTLKAGGEGKKMERVKGTMYELQEEEGDAFNAILEKGGTVAYFTATWCGPCQKVKPAVRDFAAANVHLQVVAIDVDDHEEIATRFGIISMPTFILLDAQGKQLSRAKHINDLDLTECED